MKKRAIKDLLYEQVARIGKATIDRFWRDLGYGIGVLGLGLAAPFTGPMPSAFGFVAAPMFASDTRLWWLGEATHPGLNPEN